MGTIGRLEVGVAESGEYIASTAPVRMPQLVTCVASGTATTMWMPVDVLDGLSNQRPATATECEQIIGWTIPPLSAAGVVASA